MESVKQIGDVISDTLSTTELPRFLKKTYELVDNPSIDCLHWSVDGLSVVVSDPAKLADQVLPKHFKHNKFSSFVRQLNTYGFRKTETELWQFANPYFVRGKKELLSNIVRHKAEINRNKREREPQAMVKQEERNSEKDDGALLREVQELRSYTKVDDPEDLVEESVLPEFLHTLKLSAIALEQNVQLLEKRMAVNESQHQRFMKFVAQLFNSMGQENNQERVILSSTPNYKRLRLLEPGTPPELYENTSPLMTEPQGSNSFSDLDLDLNTTEPAEKLIAGMDDELPLIPLPIPMSVAPPYSSISPLTSMPPVASAALPTPQSAPCSSLQTVPYRGRGSVLELEPPAPSQGFEVSLLRDLPIPMPLPLQNMEAQVPQEEDDEPLIPTMSESLLEQMLLFDHDGVPFSPPSE